MQTMESKKWVQGWVDESAWCKKYQDFGRNILRLSKNGSPPPFVKLFGLTSGTSVRGMAGLILVRNVFNCFNFYSIDRQSYSTICVQGVFLQILDYPVILFVTIHKFIYYYTTTPLFAFSFLSFYLDACWAHQCHACLFYFYTSHAPTYCI